jgi:hypothetical protein
MWRLIMVTITLFSITAVSHAGDETGSDRGTVGARLSTGETLQVSIIRTDANRVWLAHPVLGEFSIARHDVDLFDLDEDANGSLDSDERQPADDNTVGTSETGDDPAEWKSRFLLGFSAESGNSEGVNINASVSTKRESEHHRTSGSATYFFGQDSGDTTSNKLIAKAIHDWLFQESPWSVFVEHRVASHVGAGYELIDDDDLQVLLRAGIGAAKEFNSPRNEFIPEGLLGAEVDWSIDETQTLTGYTTFFPDLDDTGEFRNTTGAEWSWKPGDESNMALNVGVYNEYQSKVPAGFEENDLRVYGGISFDF